MRLFILLSPLFVVIALACGGGDEELAPTQTAAPSPTPAVQRPAPESLLEPGYVLDQALEANLDGSEAGQIVVVSHTVATGKGGPVAAAVPQTCPDNTVLGGAASPCTFRAEIFGYSEAQGWTSMYVEDDAMGEKPGSSITQGLSMASFHLDGSGREALVLTRVNCAASNCPVELHRVLTVADGEVTVAYEAFQARLELGPTSATFDGPVYSRGPLFIGFCCPNAFLSRTVGLDETGNLGVIDAQLPLCTEGTVAPAPLSEQAQNTLFVRCPEGSARTMTGYETTAETVVEPADVGRLAALREGASVRVEYVIKECPRSLADCDSFSTNVTPVATKITVLNP